jgi:hypothetical protein
MQKVDKIEPVENPLEDQSSQFEEPSTQVSAQLFVPFIEDDVYSISDLFSESHTKYIIHAYQEHMQTLFHAPFMHPRSHMHETPMHASQEPKRGLTHTLDSIMTFSEHNL